MPRNPGSTDKGGRPSKYSDTLAQELIRLMSEGVGVCKACKTVGISTGTISTWYKQIPGFYEECARARAIGVEHDVEKLREITDKVERGELDAKAANVISANIKWFAEKRSPKEYGIRKEVDHKSSDGSMSPTATMLTPEEVDAKLEAIKRRAQARMAKSTKTDNPHDASDLI